jgi:hypothetical protein
MKTLKFHLRKWLGIHELIISFDAQLENMKPRRDEHGRFTR